MRIIILISIILITAKISFSQNITSNILDAPDFKFENYYASKAESGDNIFLYKDNSGHDAYDAFNWSVHEAGISLTKVNKITGNVQTVPLANGAHNFGITITDLQKLNGKVYLIYDVVAEKRTIGSLVAAEVDTATLAIGSPITIADVGGAGYSLKLKVNWISEFNYFFKKSPDGKSAMVFITAGDGQYFISVLNENKDFEWRKLGRFNQTEHVEITSVAIDNSGNVYMAYQLFDKNGAIMGQTHVLVSHSKGGQTDIVLPTKDLIPQKLLLLASVDGKYIHAASYYYDTNTLCLKGAFYCNITTNGFKTGNVLKSPFTNNITDKMIQDSWGNKDEKGLGVYGQSIQNIIEMEDGTIDIAMEPYTIETGSYPGAGGVAKAGRSTMIAGSIVNAQISATKTTFCRVPLQRATASTSNGNFYFLSSYKNKPIILFDDNAINLKKDISEKPNMAKGYDNLALVAAIIDSDGNLTRQVCADLSNDDYLADIGNIFQLNGDGIFVPFIRARSFGGIKSATKFATLQIH